MGLRRNLQRRYAGPLASLLAGGLLSLCVLPLAALSDTVQERQHHPRENTYMKRQWGIEVMHVRPAAAGYMLEFRYKVLDPQKAAELFARQTKPVLVHNRTGARMIVPTPAKTGALRNSNLPLEGHTYWMFFANPAKLVQSGETVNIEIGSFLAEDLVVQ
jgi:hypothetical protein